MFAVLKEICKFQEVPAPVVVFSSSQEWNFNSCDKRENATSHQTWQCLFSLSTSSSAIASAHKPKLSAEDSQSFQHPCWGPWTIHYSNQLVIKIYQLPLSRMSTEEVRLLKHFSLDFFATSNHAWICSGIQQSKSQRNTGAKSMRVKVSGSAETSPGSLLILRSDFTFTVHKPCSMTSSYATHITSEALCPVTGIHAASPSNITLPETGTYFIKGIEL